jgi:hypothetical protein
MRRPFAYLAAAVAMAGVLAATAPASLAGVALARISGGTLSLAVADGTVWRGRGVLMAAGTLRLPVAWSMEPWPLLRGELRFRIAAPDATGSAPSAAISARHDAVGVRDLDVSLPAEIVEALAPRSGIRPGGTVRVTSPALDWTPVQFAGSARIDWQDARFALSEDSAIGLGNVTATLAAAGDRLSGPMTNAGGEFDVRGTLSLATNGATALSVAMMPRGGDPTRSRTLSLTGAPGGAGWKVDIRMGPQ